MKDMGHAMLHVSKSIKATFVHECIRSDNQLPFNSPQVLSALDILQPPHIDYFEEMYPSLLLTALDGQEFLNMVSRSALV